MNYRVVCKRAEVGHTAIAIDSSGKEIASAHGFGVGRARRALKKLMRARHEDAQRQREPFEAESKCDSVTKAGVRVAKKQPRKKAKIHGAPGVIFAALRNIQRSKGKRAGGKKTKRTRAGA